MLHTAAQLKTIDVVRLQLYDGGDDDNNSIYISTVKRWRTLAAVDLIKIKIIRTNKWTKLCGVFMLCLTV